MKKGHTYRLVIQRDQSQLWTTYTSKWEYLCKPKSFLGQKYDQNKLKKKNKITVFFKNNNIITIQN